MHTITKPKEGEYKPFTLAYINLIPEGSTVKDLDILFQEMKEFIFQLPEEKLEYRYAEGKWTIKETLIHMADTERIFSYRALRIGRNDSTNLPGFDQDTFVPYSGANRRSREDIFHEFETVRNSSVALFASLDEEAWNRVGSVDNHPISVKSIFYILAGHSAHHINVIKQRYL